MNRTIEIPKDKILSTGSLPKTGGEYTLFLQTPGNVDQMVALQDVVHDSLSEEEQTYLAYKSPDFFRGHFHGDNLMLGIAHEGKLIAQAIIVNPTPEHPKTGMSNMKLDAPVDKYTVIQGVIVDPAYRGNKLMTVMVDEWLKLAKEQGRAHAIAEVTVPNHYSWSVFMKEGLEIHSTGHDNSDNSETFNMHAKVAALIKKRLNPAFNKAAAKKTTPCPMADYEAQKKLLASGYKGVSFDAANQNILFKAPPNRRARRQKNGSGPKQ